MAIIYPIGLIEEGAKASLSGPLARPRAKQQLEVISPAAWQDRAIPPRQWIVPDWLPVGDVTLNYGEGGTGKTLLAQQLMTACATGKTWCGLPVKQCKSFGLFCEDSGDELLRRQSKINEHLGLQFSDLEDMEWASGIGKDNTLMRFNRADEGETTELFDLVRRKAILFGVRLIVIDTAATTFGGNENIRHQVTQYIGVAMSKLAQDINGAVLINAHPSRSGITTGSLDGGSTGWSGSARSRISLERPKDGHDDARVLTRRKANYASIGETIQLRWHDGVIECPNMQDTFSNVARLISAQDVFMEIFDRLTNAGIKLSAAKNAANYAPKQIYKEPDARGYKKNDFEKAMRDLIKSRTIKNKSYGRPSAPMQRLIRVEEVSETQHEGADDE